MLVLRDGQPLLTSEARFERGVPPMLADPRYERPGDTAASFPAGPHDEQLVGTWSERNRRFRFAEDGRVLRVEGDKEVEAARWWYDFPNDPFEDPTDAGTGQIQWLNSGDVVMLKLTNQQARELLLNPEGKVRRLRKEL